MGQIKFPWESSKLILWIFLVGLMGGCEEKRKMRSFPTDIFRNGDLVFRRGTGMISHTIVAMDEKSVYSHVGVMVKVGKEWKVVHIIPGEFGCKEEPDRIKIESIEVFWKEEKAVAGALMRLKGDTAKAMKAAQKAMELYKKNILFDHFYDRKDTTKMYCTELVDFIYKSVGIDLTESKSTIINIPGFCGD